MDDADEDAIPLAATGRIRPAVSAGMDDEAADEVMLDVTEVRNADRRGDSMV